MALSLTLYQPYTPLQFTRGEFVYDPRGNAFPFLYSFPGTFFDQPKDIAWKLNRITGVITEIDGDFNPFGTHGAPDMEETGNLWWAGIEPGNLTFDKQAQTSFTHDTFAKIGSVTTDGSTILYPVSGGVRVDRHGSGLVVEVELADIFFGRIHGWDRTSRVQVYDKSNTNWVYRFIDFDFDASGNLWVLSGDLTHTLVHTVDPAGAVSLVADLSGSMVSPFALKYLAADNSIIVANDATTIIKLNITGSPIATLTAPITINKGLGEQQSFHHSLDSVTDLYLIHNQFVYQVDLLNMLNGTVTDFTTQRDTAGVIWNGFSQTYLAPTYKFNGGAAFYDPVADAVWVEEAQSGCIGKFAFGGEVAPQIRTTQILAELVLRPHPPSGPVLPPPPLVFTQKNLFALIGPAQPMEVCSGYIGKPAVHSQLSQVEAHYNKELAPLRSQLHVYHTEQIGEGDVRSRDGIIWKEDPWFSMRQTDRYHRVCLFCEGDTEVTALTWMLREAGIR